MFSIYHVALDCLLGDKGSIAALPGAFFCAPPLSGPRLRGSFYFAEPRACRRITFRCRVGFIARTPVLLTARYYRASLSRASAELSETKRPVRDVRVLRYSAHCSIRALVTKLQRKIVPQRSLNTVVINEF